MYAYLYMHFLEGMRRELGCDCHQKPMDFIVAGLKLQLYFIFPFLGLLKFCTVGFCGIGSLIDFILISMQVSQGFQNKIQICVC